MFQARSSSKRSNIGTLTDRCIVLDGVDDYIQLNNTFNHEDHTVVMWVKFNGTSGDQVLFDNRDGNDDGMCIKINSDEKVVYQLNDQDITSSGNSAYVSSGVLQTGVWHHIICSFSGSLMFIWCNAAVIGMLSTGTDADISVDSTSYATLGKNRLADNSYFNGSISEIAVYNIGVPPGVVQDLYNSRDPVNHNELTISDNLQGWYTFGNADGDDAGTSNVRGLIKDNNWKHRINGDELYTLSNAAAIGSQANATTGWVISSGHTLSTSNAAHKISYGTRALKILFGVGGSGTCSTAFPATVGKIYRIQYLNRAASWQDYGDSISDVHIQVGNAAGNGGSFNEGLFTDIDSGKFYTMALLESSTILPIVFYCRIVAVDGSGNAHFTINHVGSNGSGTFWIGGFSVTEITGRSGEIINRTTSGFAVDPPDSPN